MANASPDGGDDTLPLVVVKARRPLPSCCSWRAAAVGVAVAIALLVSMMLLAPSSFVVLGGPCGLYGAAGAGSMIQTTVKKAPAQYEIQTVGAKACLNLW